MNRFLWIILVHIVLLSLCTIGFTFVALYYQRYIGASIFLIGTIALMVNMYYLVLRNHRKVIRLLDAIEYADFKLNFTSDRHLGKSFQELNQAMNQVLDTFRVTRAESESRLQFLYTLVQHVQTGILVYDTSGNIHFFNPALSNLLNIKPVPARSNLERIYPEWMYRLQLLQSGERALISLGEKQLIIHKIIIRQQGTEYSLISVQNIEHELQKNELEAWQKLASTLRHEIVNSVTPMVSITRSLCNIMDEEISDTPPYIDRDLLEEIKSSLYTVDQRGQSLVHFVEAYQNYTYLPEPNITEVNLHDVFLQIKKLLAQEMEAQHIDFQSEIVPDHITLYTDGDLLEMALLNLLKNAREACLDHVDSMIKLEGKLEKDDIRITITDNGSGIPPHMLDKIFIPFFTTKSRKGGSGIGLSITRQIIHLLNGKIEVFPREERGTRFTIHIPLQSFHHVNK